MSMPVHRLLLALLIILNLVAPACAGPKKKILLIGQGPDGVHPKGTHEYAGGVDVLAACLAKAPNIELTRARADGAWKEGPELIGRADGVVLFVSEGAQWIQTDPERLKALQQLAARGGGIVALHWALGSRDAKPIPAFLKLVGGCHGGPDRKYKVIETEAVVVPHAVTAGIKSFAIKDEFYYRLKFVEPEGSIEPLLQVEIDGKKETVAWAWQRPDKGRSAGFSGLHFHSNWERPEYRRLVAQAVLWTVKLPVPRDGLNVDIKPDELKLK
jgi:type 1 glutamine amidotransferase